LEIEILLQQLIPTCQLHKNHLVKKQIDMITNIFRLYLVPQHHIVNKFHHLEIFSNSNANTEINRARNCDSKVEKDIKMNIDMNREKEIQDRKLDVPINTNTTPKDKERDQEDKKIILVVEDNPVNLKVITKLLNIGGYKSECAMSGYEAIQHCQFKKFSVILMDIQMPGMDGLQTTKAIREMEKEQGKDVVPTPIIAVSASASEEQRSFCLEAGMNDFVGKPVRKEKLFQLLEKFMSY